MSRYARTKAEDQRLADRERWQRDVRRDRLPRATAPGELPLPIDPARSMIVLSGDTADEAATRAMIVDLLGMNRRILLGGRI